jgi:hypothetical protein
MRIAWPVEASRQAADLTLTLNPLTPKSFARKLCGWPTSLTTTASGEHPVVPSTQVVETDSSTLPTIEWTFLFWLPYSCAS